MIKINDEIKKEITENNNTISKLLEKNETLYLSNLSDIERRLFVVDDKINIPNGYVRKKDDFISIYNLKNITSNYQHQSNIAYLMQYADLMHYFFTRFNIFGQVLKVHYYYDIINLTAILEIILKELAQQYRSNCSKCKIKKQICKNIITKEIFSDLKKLLSILNKFGAISLSENDILELNDLIDLRNKIHLRLMDNTLYNNKKLDKNYFNKNMIIFKKLIKSINIYFAICKDHIE